MMHEPRRVRCNLGENPLQWLLSSKVHVSSVSLGPCCLGAWLNSLGFRVIIEHPSKYLTLLLQPSWYDLTQDWRSKWNTSDYAKRHPSSVYRSTPTFFWPQGNRAIHQSSTPYASPDLPCGLRDAHTSGTQRVQRQPCVDNFGDEKSAVLHL